MTRAVAAAPTVKSDGNRACPGGSAAASGGRSRANRDRPTRAAGFRATSCANGGGCGAKISIERARGANPMPLPPWWAAPPQIVQQKVSNRPAPTPLPMAVSKPPSLGSGASRESRGKEKPLMLALGGASGNQAAGNQKETRAKDPVALPSAGKTQSAASSSGAQGKPSAPAISAAAPVVASLNAPQQPVAVAVPAPAHIVTPEPVRSSAAAGPVVVAMSTTARPAPATPLPTTSASAAASASTLAAPKVSAAGSSPQTSTGDTPKGSTEASTQQSLVRVTYHGGLLAIEASNVTLAEVLKAVAAKTGATIDVPAGTGQERIVERAGPGKPNDVMTQLLNGSHFNFILMNSPQNPDELAQVLLSVQPGDSGAVVAQAPSTPVAVPNPSTPPATTAAIEPQRPLDYDLTQVPPDMSREAMGDFMKDRFRQILERQKQNQPQQ